MSDTTTVSQDVPEKTMTARAEVLAGKVKAVHGGNVGRITVSNAEGHTVIETPVSAGVVAPVVVAVAVIAGLVNRGEVEVERPPGQPAAPAAPDTTVVPPR